MTATTIKASRGRASGKTHQVARAFARVVVVGTIALADRFDQPDIGVRHLRRTLITRARIEGFLLDDHASEYETALADLLSWYKKGLLRRGRMLRRVSSQFLMLSCAC
ncbi:hypothetical protein [Mesorhizobium sp. M4B.F.Ca.ET.049.02.1.2]|uniref:hypothetical protein n=1 Tax=Mesorhizobium sp. M4B.F.Ca.ET.049.02.1.2 TaxID=2496752 RepID=UPI000FCC527C|nr:hypothetical protein [Mesorhizobium sp. M4B.F.Ca.ET.049.02.1.2]RUW65384.1 hypothetical protein EOA31_33795 [Mesorhizobium sp. M4B.F.Ca.ET.049.02.1.2]